MALVWDKRLQLHFSFHNGLNLLVCLMSLASAEEQKDVIFDADSSFSLPDALEIPCWGNSMNISV